MSANPYRGEVPLVLGGESHVLRPTFAALVAAEEEVGSLLALAERTGAGQLRLSETVALFWHCLDRRGEAGASEQEPDRAAFSDAVAATGLAACAEPLRAILRQVLQGLG